MAQDHEDVFEAQFNCENCGDTWKDTFPTQTRVMKHSSRVLAVDTTSVSMDEDSRSVMVCPTCKLNKSVEVESRTPIDNEE